MTHTHAFPNPWVLKYDELRKANRWTAIGPEGRIGDFETKQEALDAMAEAAPEKKGPPYPMGRTSENWGAWWVTVWGQRVPCDICGGRGWFDNGPLDQFRCGGGCDELGMITLEENG